MIYGMGTVFTFLALLIVVTVSMSKLIGRMKDEAITETANAGSAPVHTSTTHSGTPDAHLLSVLQAAVDAHRSAK